MTSFNNRLKILRLKKGLTQPQLAEDVGLSKSTIGMYEQGRREPDLETLEVLADYFNVDADYLMGRSDKVTVLPERLVYENQQTSADLRYVLDKMKHATDEQQKTIRKLVDAILLEDENNY